MIESSVILRCLGACNTFEQMKNSSATKNNFTLSSTYFRYNRYIQMPEIALNWNESSFRFHCLQLRSSQARKNWNSLSLVISLLQCCCRLSQTISYHIQTVFRLKIFNAWKTVKWLKKVHWTVRTFDNTTLKKVWKGARKCARSCSSGILKICRRHDGNEQNTFLVVSKTIQLYRYRFARKMLR